MGTGVFSEHRGRTGKDPGRDAKPADMLCKKERRENEKIPQNPGARDLALYLCLPCINKQTKQNTGTGAKDTAQCQSPGLSHPDPDFHSQAHKEVKKPRNSEYHLDSSKVHEKPWKLELAARFSFLEVEHLCVLGTWSRRVGFRLQPISLYYEDTLPLR